MKLMLMLCVGVLGPIITKKLSKDVNSTQEFHAWYMGGAITASIISAIYNWS